MGAKPANKPTALAVVDQTAHVATVERHFSDEDLRTLADTIARGASESELRLFVAVCQRTGLDPFARQIYWIAGRGPLSSIDGFRSIADRTGQYDGSETAWCDESGQWTDIWLKKSAPFAARVTVYRKGCTKPFIGTARFDEYTTGKGQWLKMPALMIAKCAEALALRKGFPSQLSGVYTTDEMNQAGVEVIEGEVVSSFPKLSPEEKERQALDIRSTEQATRAQGQTRGPDIDPDFTAPDDFADFTIWHGVDKVLPAKGSHPEKNYVAYVMTCEQTGKTGWVTCWSLTDAEFALDTDNPAGYRGPARLRLKQDKSSGFWRIDKFYMGEPLEGAEGAAE